MATGTLERSGRSPKKQQGAKFVARPKRIGRTPPQRQGPSPELSGPYFLANPGEPKEGEFDLSPQGHGVRVGNYVVALERSIVHAADAVVCCDTVNGTDVRDKKTVKCNQWMDLEILSQIPFCPIRKDESMMWVPTPAGNFRLWIVNANYVRFSPVEE